MDVAEPLNSQSLDQRYNFPIFKQQHQLESDMLCNTAA